MPAIMNFSAISRGTLLGRTLRGLLGAIPREAVVPVLQGRLRGRKWIVGSCDHGCWLGSYECPKQRLFSRTLQPGGTVFDVGAHAGFYTLLAAELVGPGGRVVSFEPLPRNLGYLRRHVQLNGCENVEVIAAAVCDRDGLGRFQPDESSLQGRLSDEGALRVPTVRLDSLVSAGTIPPPNFVKMDIEGGEFRALRGGRETLAAARPVVFLATHGPEVHGRCCELLRQLDYRLEPVRPAESIQQTDEIIAYP